jgi:hypothetical protein
MDESLVCRHAPDAAFLHATAGNMGRSLPSGKAERLQTPGTGRFAGVSGA